MPAIADAGIGSTKISGINKSLLTTDSNPYKFSARRNAAQTPIGTAKVLFDAEDFDTNSNFDSVTNNRYVAPVDGFYWFNATANCATANRLLLYFYKNGSAVKRAIDFFSGVGQSTNASCILQLTAGDYVEIYINTSNQALSVGSGSDRTDFQGFLISRT